MIEPGGIRTDWAGSSMTIHETRDDYQASVGMMAQIRESEPTAATGDPAKMAQAILQVADAENPPAQLPLGSDAVMLARAADEAQLAELARWEELSLSTDADDARTPDLSALQPQD